MKKVTIKSIIKGKGQKPITCLTAYSKDISKILDKYCDIILVGDSVGMVLYGMKTTRGVSVDTMILHGKAVKRSSKRSLVVIDMPHNTYNDKITAYKNAKKIINSTNCDAVKLEGGKKIKGIIKFLTQKGIPVMGHVGLLPQYSDKFKLMGRNNFQKRKILEDAKAISDAGVFAIVIECVVESLAKTITKNVLVPTIGIGGSKFCDGQVLVTNDMIGLSNFYPKFVKRYSNVSKVIENSVKRYCNDVKKRKFPFQKNIYKF